MPFSAICAIGQLDSRIRIRRVNTGKSIEAATRIPCVSRGFSSCELKELCMTLKALQTSKSRENFLFFSFSAVIIIKFA